MRRIIAAGLMSIAALTGAIGGTGKAIAEAIDYRTPIGGCLISIDERLQEVPDCQVASTNFSDGGRATTVLIGSTQAVLSESGHGDINVHGINRSGYRVPMRSVVLTRNGDNTCFGGVTTYGSIKMVFCFTNRFQDQAILDD